VVDRPGREEAVAADERAILPVLTLGPLVSERLDEVAHMPWPQFGERNVAERGHDVVV
jgi:hypothetical protein